MSVTDHRAQLERLVVALDASPRSLQRDQCDDWQIRGKLGHVYVDGAGYLLIVMSDESARRWNSVKARLHFCYLLNDGDDEGCFHLDRLPTPAEVAVIREALGIRKRRHLSDDAKAKAQSAAERARSCINRPLAAEHWIFSPESHADSLNRKSRKNRAFEA
jgi:hypothetical protein